MSNGLVFVMCTAIYGIMHLLENTLCEREPFNHINRYAVAVLKNDIIVGHLPKKFSSCNFG